MEEIAKLGTVLAVSNQVHKDALALLEKQQQRQVRVIWAALAITAMSVCVVGLAVFMTFHSLNKISAQVEQNSLRVEQNAEMFRNAHTAKTSQAVSR